MAPDTLTPGARKDVRADGVNVTSKVTIMAPAQADGKVVSYSAEPAVSFASLADPTSFRPGRLIANIRLSKASAINPPVKLGIELTQADVTRANGRKFKVGYHDGQQWVVMKDNIPCAVGNTEVELSKVGDPPLGLAP
jgi:hypothetical protein